MSQSGMVDIEKSYPQIPTSFNTDSGTAIPLLNVLEVLGDDSGLGGINTSGSGNTLTVAVSVATVGTDSASATKGIASFDSTYFTVSDGFISLDLPSLEGVLTVTTDEGGDPVEPDVNGNLNILGTNGITTSGQGTSSTVTVSGVNATTSVVGVVELATDAETIAGSSSTLATTPSGVNAKLGSQTANSLPYGTGTSSAIAWTSALTDGQIVIGATGAAPAAANITSTGGTVTITNTANGINLEADDTASGVVVTTTNFDGWLSSSDTDVQTALETLDDYGKIQQTIYYVGKHGNDSNNGLSIETAFLTFGAALTAASSGDVIRCVDRGAYVENLTGVTGVDIFAEHATLQGVHTLGQLNLWEFSRLIIDTGTTGFTCNISGSAAGVKASKVECDGSAIGFLATAGSLFVDVGKVEVGSGAFIGSTSVDILQCKFFEILFTDAGLAFGAAGGANFDIIGDSIKNDGVSGDGTAFYTTGVGSTYMSATISDIDIETLSNISSSDYLNLNVARLDGTLAESGTGNAIVGGASRIDGVPIGGTTPAAGEFSTLGVNTAYDFPTVDGTAGQIMETDGLGNITWVDATTGITWVEVTSTSQSASVNYGYVCNNAALVTVTLPTTAEFGDIIQIIGKGAGGWKLAQNASQTIHFGTENTTTGTGGYLESRNQYDCIEIKCITANTDFTVCASQGIIDVT